MSTNATHSESSTAPDHHADPLVALPREDDCGVCDGTGVYEHAGEHVTCFACVSFDDLDAWATGELPRQQEARDDD